MRSLLFIAVVAFHCLAWMIIPPVHMGSNGRPTIVQDPIQFGEAKVWSIEEQIINLRRFLRTYPR